MKLIYCPLQMQACVDYVNEFNPAIDKNTSLSYEDLLDAAENLIDMYGNPTHFGIMFKYQEVGEDILVTPWVLPYYVGVDQVENMRFASIDITEMFEENMARIEKEMQEVVDNLKDNPDPEDIDPRLSNLKIPEDKSKWN